MATMKTYVGFVLKNVEGMGGLKCYWQIPKVLIQVLNDRDIDG